MENKRDDFSNINILSMVIWVFISVVFLTSVNSTIIPERYCKEFSSIIIYLTILGWLFNNFKKNNIKNSLVYGKIKNYGELFISLVASVILCIISIFIVVAVLNFLSRINLYVFQNTQTSQSNVIDGPTIIYVVDTVIIAPLVEEMFFRGYLLNKLSERYKVGTALIISTVTFSLVHLQRFWSVILLGVFLSVIYVKTKSLLISIICHSTNNAFVCIMGFCLSNNDFEKLLPYGSIVLMISVPLIIYCLYRIWPSSDDVSPYQYNKANL